MNDIEVLKTGHNYLVKERQNTVSRQQIEKCITDLICSNGGHIDNLSIIHDALRNASGRGDPFRHELSQGRADHEPRRQRTAA